MVSIPKIRCRHDIDAKILHASLTGEAITRIMYNCNLNFILVKDHTARLLSRKLLQKKGDTYYTTQTGKEYIKYFETLEAL